VWLEYARFALERGRPKAAQDVFVRALAPPSSSSDAPLLDDQDRQLLWSEFLEATRASTGNPSLTLQELRAALRDQQAQPPSSGEEEPTDGEVPDAHPSSSSPPSDSLSLPPAKKPRLLDAPPAADPSSSDSGRTFVVTDDAVQAEAAALTERLLSGPRLPDEIYGAWLLMDGTEDPAAAASSGDPPLGLFRPSPPKLSDPTGRDLLGAAAALQLIRKISDPHGGPLVLETCRALWALQAASERSIAARLEGLDAAARSRASSLHADLRARLSASTAASERAVRAMNDGEWRAFEAAFGQRRREALAQAAWERRRVLYLQQSVLAAVGVPGFGGPGAATDPAVVERQSRACAFLHSAFYLRARIGDGPHRAMLESQAGRLERELAEAGAAAAAMPLSPRSPAPAADNRSPRLSPLSTTASVRPLLPPSLSAGAPQLGISYRPQAAPVGPLLYHHPQQQQHQQPLMMPSLLPPPPRGVPMPAPLPPGAGAGYSHPPPAQQQHLQPHPPSQYPHGRLH
jgi:hypothetical protein